MATKEFWQMMEHRYRKEEERVKKLFKEYGENYSYSGSEVNALRRLGLVQKIKS